MRLLNVHTLKISDHNNDNIPPYAILSHTWGEEEVTYVDFLEGKASSLKGYAKIQGCCKQTIADGLEFVVRPPLIMLGFIPELIIAD
jgi:hypothetical protein